MADPFLQYQMDEAAKAEAKEKQRQADLAVGRNKINAIFDGGKVVTKAGGPVTTTRPLTQAEKDKIYAEAYQKARIVAAPPAGYSAPAPYVPAPAPAPAKAATAAPAAAKAPAKPVGIDMLFRAAPKPATVVNNSYHPGAIDLTFKGPSGVQPQQGGTVPGFFINGIDNNSVDYSPSGLARTQKQYDAAAAEAARKAVENAGPFSETHDVAEESETYGGIGQAFYDGFRKTLNDFYTPEVERQYGKAKQENLYDLARRGTLRSSDAVTKSSDLTTDYAGANAKVKSDIEGQVTGLQSDVNNSRLKALNLLTSTEDPTTAANLASSELNAIQSKQPAFNDLGDLFARAIGSYATYNDARTGRAAVNSVPQRSPYQSSGRVI